MTSRGRFVVAAAAVALTLTLRGGALDAIYMKPDLENVPVARLVANLERELAADPKSADIHLRLARLYAMAYAANADELPTTVVAGRSSQGNPEVWFGHEPNVVPADIPPGTPRTSASKVYLQKSVDHYKTSHRARACEPGRSNRIRLDARTVRKQRGGHRRIPQGRSSRRGPKSRTPSSHSSGNGSTPRRRRVI